MSVNDAIDKSCDLLIRNAYVITMDSERRVYAHGAVAVEGAEIVDVGHDSELGHRYRAVRTIDAAGAPVHPGMFDCHVHSSLHITRGAFSDNVKEAQYGLIRSWMNAAEPEDEYASALLGSLEMVLNGTTYFLEAGTVVEPEAAASAVERIGNRASLADPYLWDVVASPIPHGMGRFPPSRIRALKELGQQLWRNGDPDTRVRGHVGLYGNGSCSDELILEAGAAAIDSKTIFTQHQNFHHSDVAFEDALLGEHALAHQAKIGALGPHCVFAHMNHIRDDEVAAVVDSGMAIAWNPGNYFSYGVGSKTPSRIPELYREGVRVGHGTDAGKMWGFGEQGFLSYLLTLGIADYLPAESILEMSTISAASALGVADRLGSLEAGKRADIVVRTNDVPEAHPSLNPIRNLVLIGRGRTVDIVIVDGEVIVEGGRATRVDQGEVYELAEAAARRLSNYVGLPPGTNWAVQS